MVAGRPTFLPSGMTKNGSTQPWASSTTWVAITGWTANTGPYPGSTVSSDKLVVQGTKSNATITASVPYSNNFSSASLTIRVVDQSGNAIGSAGVSVTAASGTATCTVTGVNLASITSVGIQMQANFSGGAVVSATTPSLTIT
ncbi:hypothetical protein ACW2Q0_00455 [Nocardia sp. R16R-3T]